MLCCDCGHAARPTSQTVVLFRVRREMAWPLLSPIGLMGELGRFAWVTLIVASLVILVCSVLGAEDIGQGAALFDAECASCHGRRATGGLGPDLTRGSFRIAVDDDAMFRVIASGIPGSRMPGALGRHSAEDVWQLVGFVRSLSPATAAVAPGAEKSDRPRAPVEPSRAIATIVASAPDANQTVRVTTADGTVHTGRRMDEDTFSVRLLDDRGTLRSFERSTVRTIERVAAVLPPRDSAEILDIAARPVTPTK
jgi:mono/diheme cytochrome c family protein